MKFLQVEGFLLLASTAKNPPHWSWDKCRVFFTLEIHKVGHENEG